MCGLFFLMGGCTIHVVEQPATPGPAVLVADGAEARPTHRHHHHPAPAPEPEQGAATPQAEPGRAAPPSRSDLTPRRPNPRAAQPQKDKPLYTPFRSVGSDKVSSPLSARPTSAGERHKVELPHD